MTPSDQAPIQETPEQPALKKAITPKLLVLFIVGDILGTGVYALTGEVAGQVGGAGWLPIIIAFAIAMVSALSYVEMVTKYPHAAGRSEERRVGKEWRSGWSREREIKKKAGRRAQGSVR